MYSKLKQVMKDSGYRVSEGGDWASTDTPEFQAFAKFTLGVQNISPNQVMAYPQAFPELAAAFARLGNIEVPVAAPVDAPAEEIDPPAASAAEPVAEPTAEPVVEQEQPLEQPAGEQPTEQEPAGDAPTSDSMDVTGEA
jgi:hypothetical protein